MKLLHDAIHQLTPTGFEKLARCLLEDLTGLRFYDAKSGSQDGRDAATRTGSDIVIHIESKRYGLTETLNSRDVEGGLSAAIRTTQDLDIWCLAATCEVADQQASALARTAENAGVTIEIIDWRDGDLPELAILCASNIDLTLAQLGVLSKSSLSSDTVAQILDILKQLKSMDGFDVRLQLLEEKFTKSHIGLSAARQELDLWLKNAMSSRSEAKNSLGQPVNLTDPNTPLFVPRQQIENQLSEWWHGWKDNSIFMLLGQEGMGKTWSAISWMNTLIKGSDNSPLIIFVTSWHHFSDDPTELAAKTILDRSKSSKGLEFWKKRVKRWLQGPVTDDPIVLFLLDGLNERRDAQWERFFIALQTEPWRSRAAVLATCRPRFWEDDLKKLQSLEHPPLTGTIEPFNDAELETALAAYTLSPGDLSQSVRDLARKPRIFQLAMKLREELEESGDVTVDRLLYENWRDLASRPEGDKYSPENFRTFLIKIASKCQKKLSSFKQKDLYKKIKKAGRPQLNKKDLLKAMDNIIEGGLFHDDVQNPGTFQIDPDLNIHSLGMVLAMEVRSLPSDQIPTLINRHLDVLAGLPHIPKILRSATSIALMTENYPRDGQFELLKAWLESHNLAN